MVVKNYITWTRPDDLNSCNKIDPRSLQTQLTQNQQNEYEQNIYFRLWIQNMTGLIFFKLKVLRLTKPHPDFRKKKYRWKW